MRTLAIVAAVGLTVGSMGVHEAAAQERLVGVKAGFVTANVDEDGVDSRFSSAFGGFAQLPIGRALSVQPEVLYVSKGFGADVGSVDAEFQLSYLQIPFLLQYHLQTSGTVGPRLFAGPTVAFEIGCDLEGADGSESGSLSCDESSDIGFDLVTSKTDFGLIFGGGLDVAAGTVMVTLDGRYDVGLSDILDFEGESGVKNRAWAFFLGVGFPVGP